MWKIWLDPRADMKVVQKTEADTKQTQRGQLDTLLYYMPAVPAAPVNRSGQSEWVVVVIHPPI
jgi:hypothetical protein